MECKVSIHQPNMLPWASYFEKIASADVFVVMQFCQFPSENYVNRFKYQDRWYTMRVSKKFGESIVEKKYISPFYDYERIKRQLPEFKVYLDYFDDCIIESVAATNLAIIKKVCKLLDIKTQIVTDYPTELRATDRLVDICKHFNATAYISGPSGKNYLELDKFNIPVTFHEAQDKRSLFELLKEKFPNATSDSLK